ncbi:MAG: class D beta-lactamase [Pseudomonadota bacterium]
MIIIRICILLIAIVSTVPSIAQEVLNRDDLLEIFADHSVAGTFAFMDVETGQISVVGSNRVQQRYFPASTFKIFNSLIALETKVISDENEIVPYGGRLQPIKAWEKDMSIRQAIQVSNVPVFQEIARRVGLERYEEKLASYNFGNGLVGSDVETFWLKGPLKISAIEYVDVLATLAKQKLPAEKSNQRIVGEIIRLEVRDDATLFGKTGWANSPSPDIGWFVGWVEQGGKFSTFALNIDMQNRADPTKRTEIAKALLSALGAY